MDNERDQRTRLMMLINEVRGTASDETHLQEWQRLLETPSSKQYQAIFRFCFSTQRNEDALVTYSSFYRRIRVENITAVAYLLVGPDCPYEWESVKRRFFKLLEKLGWIKHVTRPNSDYSCCILSLTLPNMQNLMDNDTLWRDTESYSKNALDILGNIVDSGEVPTPEQVDAFMNELYLYAQLPYKPTSDVYCHPEEQPNKKTFWLCLPVFRARLPKHERGAFKKILECLQSDIDEEHGNWRKINPCHYHHYHNGVEFLALCLTSDLGYTPYWSGFQYIDEETRDLQANDWMALPLIRQSIVLPWPHGYPSDEFLKTCTSTGNFMKRVLLTYSRSYAHDFFEWVISCIHVLNNEYFGIVDWPMCYDERNYNSVYLAIPYDFYFALKYYIHIPGKVTYACPEGVNVRRLFAMENFAYMGIYKRDEMEHLTVVFKMVYKPMYFLEIRDTQCVIQQLITQYRTSQDIGCEGDCNVEIYYTGVIDRFFMCCMNAVDTMRLPHPLPRFFVKNGIIDMDCITVVYEETQMKLSYLIVRPIVVASIHPLLSTACKYLLSVEDTRMTDSEFNCFEKCVRTGEAAYLGISELKHSVPVWKIYQGLIHDLRYRNYRCQFQATVCMCFREYNSSEPSNTSCVLLCKIG
jgi:hypothetical protein